MPFVCANFALQQKKFAPYRERLVEIATLKSLTMNFLFLGVDIYKL